MRFAQVQRGVTLIALLVGLVISMIVAVALMNVFRNVIQVTSSANVSAKSDNQLTSALLRSSMSMLDAGYGVASPAFGTHLVMIGGATLSGSTLSGTAAAAGASANAVVWAMKTGTATQCAGLYAPATASATSPALYSLGPVACTDATGWSSATWTSTTVAGQGSVAISFVATQAGCQPYGITGTSGAYSVLLTTQNSVALPISITQCLLNFQS